MTGSRPPAQASRSAIRLASPELGDEEIAAVAAVLRSGVLTNGPVTEQFERDFGARHGVEHAVAFANGTVALAAMFIAAGIGEGDEVVVPSMTFISTATSVLHVGAAPVFADVDAESFNLDPEDVARKLTPRTRAILAVHYGGQPAEMDELRSIAEGAGIALFEDAAEAHGAEYHSVPVGGLGDAAMFSFTPTKNITTGEGGVVTTRDGDWARRLRLLRNHGQTERYRHETLGFNWRITEMQAAIGVVQTAKLDRILAVKQGNARWLGERLSRIDGVRSPRVRDGRTHPHMLYTLLLDRDRDRVMAELVAAGIEARLYFPPAHRQPVFAPNAAELPVTDWLAEHMLSIPFHWRLSPADLEEIATALEKAVAGSAEGRPRPLPGVQSGAGRAVEATPAGE